MIDHVNWRHCILLAFTVAWMIGPYGDTPRGHHHLQFQLTYD